MLAKSFMQSSVAPQLLLYRTIPKILVMGRAKDQLIEDAQHDRENLEYALDDIEAYGERFEWYASSVIQLLINLN